MRFIAIVMLASTSIVANAQTLKRNTKLPEGLTITKINQSKVTSNTEMMGQSMTNLAENTMTATISIAKQVDTTTEVTITITKASVKAEAMGQAMEYDSETKNDGPLQETFANIINKPNTLWVNNKGLVVKTAKKGDENADAVLTMLGGNTNMTIKEGSRINLLLTLPSNEVKVGTNWADSTEANGTKEVTFYTYAGNIGGVAKIEYRTTITQKTKMERMGMEMNSEMAGVGSGILEVDPITLLIKKRTAKLTLKGTIEAMGASIPTEVVTEMVETVQ